MCAEVYLFVYLGQNKQPFFLLVKIPTLNNNEKRGDNVFEIVQKRFRPRRPKRLRDFGESSLADRRELDAARSEVS